MFRFNRMSFLQDLHEQMLFVHPVPQALHQPLLQGLIMATR